MRQPCQRASEHVYMILFVRGWDYLAIDRKKYDSLASANGSRANASGVCFGQSVTVEQAL